MNNAAFPASDKSGCAAAGTDAPPPISYSPYAPPAARPLPRVAVLGSRDCRVSKLLITRWVESSALLDDASAVCSCLSTLASKSAYSWANPGLNIPGRERSCVRERKKMDSCSEPNTCLRDVQHNTVQSVSALLCSRRPQLRNYTEQTSAANATPTKN